MCVIIYINLSSTFKFVMDPTMTVCVATTINCDFINLSVIIGHRDAIKLSVTAVSPFLYCRKKNKRNLDPAKCLLRDITQVSKAANQSRVNIV